jgi:hypothetical protein
MHIVRIVGLSTSIIGSLKTEPQLAASPAKTALSSLGKLCPSLSADRAEEWAGISVCNSQSTDGNGKSSGNTEIPSLNLG